MAFTPVLDATYAAAPGFPGLTAAAEEMLMTDPFCFALRMSLHTCFETNHSPVKLVART